jgi:hypothetical protein
MFPGPSHSYLLKDLGEIQAHRTLVISRQG